MTKVGQMYYEEKIEYANQREREREKKIKNELAIEMLADGEEMAKIIKYSKLSKDEILKLNEISIND